MILRRRPGGYYDGIGETPYSASEEHSETTPIWRESGLRFHFPAYNSDNTTANRLTDFHVDVEWADVLTAIQHFAKNDNPAAKFLQSGLDALDTARPIQQITTDWSQLTREERIQIMDEAVAAAGPNRDSTPFRMALHTAINAATRATVHRKPMVQPLESHR